MNADLAPIGRVAERVGLSLRTIRYYDEIGLVTPSGRTVGGFRLYSPSDVERLLLIKRMKPLGYSLEEMADLLSRIPKPLQHHRRPGHSRSRWSLHLP